MAIDTQDSPAGTITGPADELLTVAEVAVRLKLTERVVRDKIAAQEFPVVRLGSGPKPRLRVSAAVLDDWIAGHDELAETKRRARRAVGVVHRMARREALKASEEAAKPQSRRQDWPHVEPPPADGRRRPRVRARKRAKEATDAAATTP